MIEDLVYRLKKRAEIRRTISSRKSVQEGKPDRLADLLDEAAFEIDSLRSKIDCLNQNNSNIQPDGPVSVLVKCKDCGHEQYVRGYRYEGRRYLGSGYDFCDVCDGKPEPVI